MAVSAAFCVFKADKRVLCAYPNKYPPEQFERDSGENREKFNRISEIKP